MNKAISIFNLASLFEQVNERIKILGGEALHDVGQELIADSEYQIVICRKPGQNGSFQEPQNVNISGNNVFKQETVKVFCEEYLANHSENKIVEYFSLPENVFNLALIYNKKKPVISPEEVKKIPEFAKKA